MATNSRVKICKIGLFNFICRPGIPKHTHTQPFYGSVEFVRENPGEPVPEETFTHYSHR